MSMIKIAHYRHSKNFKTGIPAICGPRSYTNVPRAWQARIQVDMPLESSNDPTEQTSQRGGVFEVIQGPDLRPVMSMTVNIPPLGYSAACQIIAKELETLVAETPGWTDFEWQIWTQRGKAPKVRRAA